MLAWVVFKLSQNTNNHVALETTLSDDVFDNAAMLVCFRQPRHTLRMSMMQTYDPDAEHEILVESPEPIETRKTLDKHRLMDTNDE